MNKIKNILTAALLCLAASADAQTYVHIVDVYGTLHEFSSNTISAMTIDDQPMWRESDHEYVDLGLSVKWATCNVGATAPEEYGDYYAWGETATKTDYSQTTYTNPQTFGDAATASWGGAWRTPTSDEFQELVDNCAYTTSTVNDVDGMLFTSNNNGNSIFLPFAGGYSGTAVSSSGSEGLYRTSTLADVGPNVAHCVGKAASSCYIGALASRESGFSIRPVCAPTVTPKVSVLCNSLALNQSEVAVSDEETATLTYTIAPANATSKTVIWGSDNTAVATVDADGVVTAKGAGTATITCTAIDGSGISATCRVTVYLFNGHAYVDLGLTSGTLWATCNVGADSPEKYGDYYAWGETTTKADYSLDTYSNPQTFGDAASVNWGGIWRMPTSDDFQELVNNCTYTSSTVNGVNGMLFTSNKNGNSIFLPSAGGYIGTTNSYEGFGGNYWTSSTSETGPGALYLMPQTPACNFNWGSPEYGLSVRPVCVPPVAP